jgi:hypothetical protein
MLKSSSPCVYIYLLNAVIFSTLFPFSIDVINAVTQCKRNKILKEFVDGVGDIFLNF